MKSTATGTSYPACGESTPGVTPREDEALLSAMDACEDRENRYNQAAQPGAETSEPGLDPNPVTED